VTQKTKVLLMAAGLGTRLRPLTDVTPKCLVPVAGKPLMDYWLEQFAATNLTDVLVNTHHLPQQVHQHIEQVNDADLEGRRLNIHEAYEPVLLGSAGTVHANRAWADDASTILIVYADNLSSVPIGQFLDFHQDHLDPVSIMLFKTDVPERCGIVEVDSTMLVTSFVEKPPRPISNFANAGIYAVRADAFREMADMSVFDLGTDVLPHFVGRMRGWEWDGYHRDIGTHESLVQAEEDIKAGCMRTDYRRVVNWSPS
jgi:NDP-sugar pyrophosphorylase family protein